MPNRDVAHMLIASAVFLTAAASAQAQTTPAAIPTTDVPQLKNQLYDVAATQAQHEQAAGRLLVRPDPAARVIIASALLDYGQPGVQLAAARALADNPTNDPQLITPLFALIDPSNTEPLIDAAAQGLTAFKGNADVLTRMIGLAANGSDERIRLAAIRACGTFADKRVVTTLLALMDPAAQPPRINSAAADAMTYMTGLTLPGNDLAAWQAWWQKNQDLSDADFQAKLLQTRSGRYDVTQNTVSDLQGEILRLASDRYQKANRDDRIDLLLRFMQSSEPAVRAIGCRIAEQAAETDVALAQPVKEQLRGLIGDASAAVRLQAAKALALINDADALVPLLTQLNQEPDSAVRAAIAEALRPIRDIRSVPYLLKLLDDPSIDTAQAAADALSERELGEQLRDKDPRLADQVAAQLLQTLNTRTTAQNNIELRNSLIQAMAPLQNRDLVGPLTRMLNSPAEAPKVRRSLLQAVGDYHDPQLADSIGALLDDPDPTIRIAAVRAIGQTADSFGAFEHRLSDLINPSTEKSPDVRQAAWDVLTQLFAKAPQEQLGPWELRLKDDPVRLLAVLKVERDRAAKAGTLDYTAGYNQKIGDASRAAAAKMPDAARADPYWQQAIAAYQDALTYAREQNKTPFVEALSYGLTQAYLGAHQYADAINFVEQQIHADPSLEGDLGALVRQEADRLVHGSPSDFQGAMQLIDLTLKMNPPLKTRFTDNFPDWRAEAERRSKEQNLSPYGEMDGVQNAMAR